MTQDRLDYYIDLINAAQDDYDTCFIDGYQYRARIAAILVSVAAEAAAAIGEVKK